MISVRNITKDFGTGPVLENVSIDIKRGESVVIIGDNVIIGLSPSDFRKRGSHGGLVHICLRR
jgi:ABC-type histidine transport system ATPase subunit